MENRGKHHEHEKHLKRKCCKIFVQIECVGQRKEETLNILGVEEE